MLGDDCIIFWNTIPNLTNIVQDALLRHNMILKIDGNDTTLEFLKMLVTI